MEEASKSLDFIEAANYRDEIKNLKEQLQREKQN
jgi:protein-arginine kinase activator protein McsA